MASISVNFRYIYTMRKSHSFVRLGSMTIAVVLIAMLSWAADGEKYEDEKKQREQDKKTPSIVVVDSAGLEKKEDGSKIKNQVDDTLVFEDWNGPSGGGDWDGRVRSIYEKGGTLDIAQITALSSLKTAADLASEWYVEEAGEYSVTFSVYPNPAANELHIKTEQDPLTLQILGCSGKIYEQSKYTSTVQISDLAVGMYYVQLIYQDGHIESRKFFKH